MERTDIHRPSVIVPTDYEYVGIEFMKIESFGDCAVILDARRIVKEHMERTGGTYSMHEHGGNCHICGAGCIYTVLFYHAKTNVYIRTGNDCAQKLDMAFDENAFKRFVEGVKGVREAHAGKMKAQALLADNGISAAWAIFTAEYPKHGAECTIKFTDYGEESGTCSCGFAERLENFNRYEERIIRDIVAKVVAFGAISDKQAEFVMNLLNKIANRANIEAQRAAEAAAAAPAPSGRVVITGRVLALKTQERPTYYYGDDGLSTKVLIQGLTGFKVWGNRFNNVEKGDLVTFTATIKPSDKDPKFGFFSRVAKPFHVAEATGEILAEAQS